VALSVHFENALESFQHFGVYSVSVSHGILLFGFGLTEVYSIAGFLSFLQLIILHSSGCLHIEQKFCTVENPKIEPAQCAVESAATIFVSGGVHKGMVSASKTW